jgi:hypothetical protein
MATREATEARILEALHTLDPALWGEVLDFMGFLTQCTPLKLAQAHTQPLTAPAVIPPSRCQPPCWTA